MNISEKIKLSIKNSIKSYYQPSKDKTYKINTMINYHLKVKKKKSTKKNFLKKKMSKFNIHMIYNRHNHNKQSPPYNNPGTTTTTYPNLHQIPTS